jgi:hypothetical protein
LYGEQPNAEVIKDKLIVDYDPSSMSLLPYSLTSNINQTGVCYRHVKGRLLAAGMPPLTREKANFQIKNERGYYILCTLTELP